MLAKITTPTATANSLCERSRRRLEPLTRATLSAASTGFAWCGNWRPQAKSGTLHGSSSRSPGRKLRSQGLIGTGRLAGAQ